MQKGQYRDFSGELVTVTQMAEAINSGTSTVRRLAAEAGAVRRIGRSYRINKKVFLEYIEAVCSE